MLALAAVQVHPLNVVQEGLEDVDALLPGFSELLEAEIAMLHQALGLYKP